VCADSPKLKWMCRCFAGVAERSDLAAAFLALFHGLALQRMPGVDNPKAISAGTLVILILESLLSAAQPVGRLGG